MTVSLPSLQEQVRYCEETEEMADSMYAMVVPWRWLEWRRTAREVKRRIAQSKAWRAERARQASR